MSSTSVSASAPTTISRTAGTSAVTLQALSEYCASTDSPTLSSFGSDSSYSFLDSETPKIVSPPAALQPALPDILASSSRFQSASVQEKMLKALKASTGSGFTRAVVAPSSNASSSAKDRATRLASTQAIFEGLPPSPSDSFFSDTSLISSDTSLFSDASLVEASSATHIGLGLLVPSSFTNELRLLSPLSMRRPSPIIAPKPKRPILYKSPAPQMVRVHCAVPREVPASSSLKPPHAPQVSAPASTPRVPSSSTVSRYVGLGHGLPTHMRATASPRFISGLSAISGLFTGSIRAVSSGALSNLVPSGSFIIPSGSFSGVPSGSFSVVPSGSLNSMLLPSMPALTRCPRAASHNNTSNKVGDVLSRLRRVLVRCPSSSFNPTSTSSFTSTSASARARASPFPGSSAFYAHRGATLSASAQGSSSAAVGETLRRAWGAVRKHVTVARTENTYRQAGSGAA
ncbi:hypothetical protein C8R43DRAFT_1230390 [Mycena crocata]|nr:hypothetical protein C8R43DRAFT_1230390 [Mycena crocata]